MNAAKIYDVLIVGAGPVGLSTAIALCQRGINNILVIDRTRSFRKVGQVVDILPNGLKSLKHIDEAAYQQIKTTGLNFIQAPRQESNGKKTKPSSKRFWSQKNLQGEVIRAIPLDFESWFEGYGEGRVSLPWYDLQTNLRKLLPPEIVKVNHRCVDLRQDKYVEVDCVASDENYTNPFAHWERQSADKSSNDDKDRETNRQTIQAKLVVAADGINSTIRQLMYSDRDLTKWAEPQYSGFAAIGCLQIDNVPDEIVEELEEKYFQGDRVVTLINNAVKSGDRDSDSPRFILIRRGSNSLGYLFHTPLSLDSLQNKSSEGIIDLAANIIAKANFPPVFSQVINLSNRDRLFSRFYYIHPADILKTRSIWSNKRIVLVGDAAHGMPPFAAQGANQGLEDAAIIGTAIASIINNNDLDNLEIISDLFSKYEQLRRPFMARIQEATMENHNWSQAKWNDYSDRVYSRNVEDFMSDFVY